MLLPINERLLTGVAQRDSNGRYGRISDIRRSFGRLAVKGLLNRHENLLFVGALRNEVIQTRRSESPLQRSYLSIWRVRKYHFRSLAS